MPAVNPALRSTRFLATFLTLSALAAAGAHADIYDAAVAHYGRSAEDLKRDPIDHPAEVLRLSGIGPGMRVGDVLAAGGYYSELLSYIVGARGHVVMLNNKATDFWSDNYWEKRLANRRLPNVEHRLIDGPGGREPAPDEPGADRGLRRELAGQCLHHRHPVLARSRHHLRDRRW